jgi:ABC-2 type transport system ATP-binding protein
MEAGNVCKSYRKQTVLRGASFSLARGRILGILGPNGAGKTTLLKIMALLMRPDKGTVRYGGLDAAQGRQRIRPGIGYVPQDVALFDDLSVRDNLVCWSRLGLRGANRQADRLIGELNLQEFASKKISALSGGMKRRVNLAVALLDDPEALILDEPLVGVDIEQRRQITDTLRRLAQKGVTILIASHHADELIPLADDIMVMKDGDILFLGQAEKLIEMRNDRGTDATLEEVVLALLNDKREGA